MLATCATVHITPLILSLRAWGGRVGDSQSDGGGQRSYLRKPMRCPDCLCLQRYLRLHCSTRCRMLVREMYVSCDVLSGLARRLTEHVARSALLKRGLERVRGTVVRVLG